LVCLTVFKLLCDQMKLRSSLMAGQSRTDPRTIVWSCLSSGRLELMKEESSRGYLMMLFYLVFQWLPRDAQIHCCVCVCVCVCVRTISFKEREMDGE